MISSSVPTSVSIIGASVGGLTLGLVLKRYGIQSRFFELRDPETDLDGAMSLTPNALRVMECIGAYSRIRSQGYNFEAMTFMKEPEHETTTSVTNPEHEVTGKLYFGQKDVYGYDGLRIERKVLIRELTKMVNEAGLQITYGKKFTKIVHEDVNEGVEFEFADGTREKDQMLIGADGIYSKVRSHILPDIHPQYSGFLGLTYCFPRANVQAWESLPLPASLRGKQGSVIIQPQAEGGKEIFVGRQISFEQKDHSRVGWNKLLQDKSALIGMIQRDPSAWTPLVQAVSAQVSTPEAHFLNVWPFYTIPKMDCWHSSTGRVIILGDAAHAIPPSAGQGANQALEDSYSLGLLLASLDGEISLTDALKAWEAYRTERMDDVLKLTNRLMTLRMTEEERANMPEDMRWELDGSEAGKAQLGWLYSVDIDRDVKKLVKILGEKSG